MEKDVKKKTTSSETRSSKTDMKKMGAEVPSGPSSEPKKHAKPTTPEETSSSAGFDLARYRLSQDFAASAGVTKLLTTVPVRKPSPHTFVAFSERPDYRMDTVLLSHKEENEFYLLAPEVAQACQDEGKPFTLYTYVTRAGNIGIWPVRLPDCDGRDIDWWRSARDAATMFPECWVRIKSSKELGAYEVFQATGELEPPVWPPMGFADLVKLAFRDKIIETMDHPVLRRLRGEI